MTADGSSPERRLYLAERQLALLCECVGDSATGLLDGDGVIADWHETAAATGHPPDRLPGLCFAGVFDGAGEALALAREAGRYRGEHEMRHADGTSFPAEITLEGIHDDGQCAGFCVVVVRDLTRQRQWQRQLAEARAQLFQCQKIEALGQLTSGIAHDFNNLLQGIVGSLNVIAMQLERSSTEGVAHFIAHATESAHGASVLTRKLLTLARPRPANDESVDVNARVRSVAEIVSRTLGEHITLRLELAGDLRPVRCDAQQLESVLLNLAINARDAMPNGGELTFATHDAPPGSAGPCRSLPPTDQHSLCLEVTDSGIGMDARTRERALEPFFTTKPEGRGTGLGLSMIRSFIDQTGGGIELDSEPGRGTTVRLRLPCCDGQAAEASHPDPVAPRKQPAPDQTILVVEDSATVRELLATTLRDRHYRVLEAANGPEGLALLRSSVRIDLVISDVGLPGMKGPAMMRAAVSRPHMKVLFITGYGQPPSGDAACGVGVDWLAKPFSMTALLDRVGHLLS